MELKFYEIKRDYLSELRLILNDNTNEKIGNMLEKNNFSSFSTSTGLMA